MLEIKLKKITPLDNYVVTTSDRYSKEECAEMHGGIIRADLENQIKPYQKIVAVSKFAESQGFEAGQLVAINIDRYAQVKQKKDGSITEATENYRAVVQYNVPALELDGEEVLKLGTNDLMFIIDEHEMVETKPKKTKSGLIIPEKGIIPGNC